MARAPDFAALLRSLNIKPLPGPKKAKPVARDPKEVLVESLEQQKKYVDATLTNGGRYKTGKLNDDGTPETIDLTERMVWWKQNHEIPGTYSFAVKYGVNSLRMPGQDETEKANGPNFKNFNELPPMIDILITLVKAGQFDAELNRVKEEREAAAAKRKANKAGPADIKEAA